MRGDRPELTDKDLINARATPHARGSTRASCVILARLTGYPACAGIDLTSVTRMSRASRLPRMRGDRPAKSMAPE